MKNEKINMTEKNKIKQTNCQLIEKIHICMSVRTRTEMSIRRLRVRNRVHGTKTKRGQ